MGLLWDDPWIHVATQRGEGRVWNTTLPPPAAPALPDGATFQCTQTLRRVEAWADFVGTGWGASALIQRLEGAWIPQILDSSGELLATCVLRPRGSPERLWLLETLRARRGFGSLLIRHVFAWLGAAGPFVLGFTWELTVTELAYAWWRGWLRAAAAIEYGWIWRRGCSFCPGEGVDPHRRPVFELPTLLRFGSAWAVVSDSGLHDGMGNVQAWEGAVPWTSVAEAGGWSSLWTRAGTSPAPKWLRTGEIVVVGLVNSGAERAQRWITAEI
jgi:hypothetical protein